MMLIPLDDVKDWLKITVDTHDATLTALEERASGIIQRELRWYFGAPQDVVEALDGTGTPKMFLHQPPSDGATVVVESRSGVGQDWTVVDAGDYELDGRGLYVAVSYRWTQGLRNYRASYKEGFDAVPDDIQQIVLDLIATVWNRRGHQGFASERIGDYSYSLADLDGLLQWGAIKSSWRRGRI